MALPYPISQTGNTASTGNLNITIEIYPVLADDLMLLHFASQDNVAPTLPGGWTILQEGNNGASLRTTLAWKRAVGGEESDVITVTHAPAVNKSGRIIIYRGVLASGDPFVTSGITHNASSATCTGSALDVGAPLSLLLFFQSATSAGISTNYTLPTVANGAAGGRMWEMYDSVGSRCPQAVADAVWLGGDTGAFTSTLSAARVNSAICVALAPEPAAEQNQTDNTSTSGTGYTIEATGVCSGSISGSDLAALVVVYARSRDGTLVTPNRVVYDKDEHGIAGPEEQDMVQVGPAWELDSYSTVTLWRALGVANSASQKVISAYFDQPGCYRIIGETVPNVDTTYPFIAVTSATGTRTTPMVQMSRSLSSFLFMRRKP